MPPKCEVAYSIIKKLPTTAPIKPTMRVGRIRLFTILQNHFGRVLSPIYQDNAKMSHFVAFWVAEPAAARVRDDPPVQKSHDPAGALGHVLVVCDHDDRPPAFVELAEERQDIFAGTRVEI